MPQHRLSQVAKAALVLLDVPLGVEIWQFADIPHGRLPTPTDINRRHLQVGIVHSLDSLGILFNQLPLTFSV